MIDSNVVKPIGDKCFEALSAGDAGFKLNFLGENLIESQGLEAGDFVRITYDGYVVETAPGQIYPDSVEPFAWDTSEQTEAPFDYETLFDYEMQHKPTYADYLKIETDMTVEEVVEILGKPHGTDAAAGSKYLLWEMAEGGSCIVKVVSLNAKENPTEWSDILKPHYGGAIITYHYIKYNSHKSFFDKFADENQKLLRFHNSLVINNKNINKWKFKVKWFAWVILPKEQVRVAHGENRN